MTCWGLMILETVRFLYNTAPVVIFFIVYQCFFACGKEDGVKITQQLSFSGKSYLIYINLI
jgi:hypothetical protein